MSSVFNTSYKVHTDFTSDAVRNECNVEDGAMVTTETGVYVAYSGSWRKIYPQAGAESGLGWTRYDDGQYTSANKLSLTDGVEITLPNNGASVYRSYAGIDYYNSANNKMLGSVNNDVYLTTVVFKCSAANANQTYLRIQLDSINGTPYERVGKDVAFPRGNDVAHEFHEVFQYYITPDFITSGSNWKVMATGGSAQIWDIIYFIQKTQSYA